MRRARQTSVRPLLACAAVLLVAGVLAAVRVGASNATSIGAGGPVGAASVEFGGLPADQAPSTTGLSVIPTSAHEAAPASTTARRSATTTTPPAATPATTATTMLRVETRSTVPPPTTTTVPSTMTWSADRLGLTARITMTPATPRAGEPVTFSITLAPVDGCCSASLAFGDGRVAGVGVFHCTNTEPVRSAVTHTYVANGVYSINFEARTTPCVGPDSPPPSGPNDRSSYMRAVGLYPCVGVGVFAPTGPEDCFPQMPVLPCVPAGVPLAPPGAKPCDP